jgi:hypothetical protein
LKASVELVLPLLHQATGADDQAAPQISANEQLLDEQPGHNRLAGAGVVGQEKAEWLPGEHLTVDSSDLVGKRVDQRGVDCEDRVEQVSEADAPGLGDQPEHRSVPIEVPGTALGHNFEGGLPVAVEDLTAQLAGAVFVGDLQRRGAVPGGVNDGDKRVSEDPLHRRAPGELFQSCQGLPPAFTWPVCRAKPRRSPLGQACQVSLPWSREILAQAFACLMVLRLLPADAAAVAGPPQVLVVVEQEKPDGRAVPPGGVPELRGRAEC